MEFASLMTFKLVRADVFLLISLCAIAAHLVFNRFEPTHSVVLFILLITTPGILSATLLPHFDNPIIAVIVGFSIYFLVLILSIVIYRLSPFHPLARYPGPMLHRISKFRAAWIGTSGKHHLYYENLHRKYGDVVRIGPNELYIRDPEVTVPLHGMQGLSKGPQSAGRLMKTSLPSLTSIRDPEVHRQRRLLWQRGLNITAIKDYEPLIRKRVRQLVDCLENLEDSVVDIAELFGFFSYDFMSDMAFGGGSEMLRDGDVHGLWKLQDDALYLALFFSHIPWIASFSYLASFLSGDLFKFRWLGIAAAEKRKNEGSMNKDLFYHLIDEGGIDKESPSMGQVVSDGSLAIVAGSDTTANVLSNLFFFLLRNSHAYKRLQAEVNKFYPMDEDALSTQFHGHMTYLSACLNESMRLLPQLAEGSQRAPIKGMGDKVIGPYHIPEGTAVSSHIYSIQRDPRNFSPAADIFWPERWLVADGLEAPPKDFIHNMAAFTPFSCGPANCVGKHLALQNMKTVVCAIMQRLDIRFADGYDSKRWFEELRNIQILKRGNLPVFMTRRR